MLLYYKFGLHILFKYVPFLEKKTKTEIFVPIVTSKHIRKDAIFVLTTIQVEIILSLQ